MSDAFEGRSPPKGVLIALSALVILTILGVGVARLTGYKFEQAPILPEVESRDIRFVEQADGSMEVRDVATGELIQTLPPGQEGFVRGVLRALARQRKGYHTDLSQPFHLARRANGMLTLEDPVTGILLDLRAYGVDNEGAFAAFMSGR
ncbi:phosphonoacetaldehyde hydrolase [Caldichromatium japonicum]|uniref:Phosphonoacetaldehyde hydrolase n=1 Tax=Caldichromatium japonicum TaxID=2699430 RepID=A0A6G7VFR4_9GAMM|nr:photosynthetic complex assembly protein PuhC [Caldichromatium japonicum]QIK38792.1 phosphonoacetaldehyde hydrolase [Caldichromatium japonicum]